MAVFPADLALQLQLEEQTLIKAEMHISEGRSRISQQEMLLCQLETDRHDTVEAERLVEILRRTLFEWERHLYLIRQRIAHLRKEIDQARPKS